MRALSSGGQRASERCVHTRRDLGSTTTLQTEGINAPLPPRPSPRRSAGTSCSQAMGVWRARFRGLLKGSPGDSGRGTGFNRSRGPVPRRSCPLGSASTAQFAGGESSGPRSLLPHTPSREGPPVLPPATSLPPVSQLTAKPPPFRHRLPRPGLEPTARKMSAHALCPGPGLSRR